MWPGGERLICPYDIEKKSQIWNCSFSLLVLSYQQISQLPSSQMYCGFQLKANSKFHRSTLLLWSYSSSRALSVFPVEAQGNLRSSLLGHPPLPSLLHSCHNMLAGGELFTSIESTPRKWDRISPCFQISRPLLRFCCLPTPVLRIHLHLKSSNPKLFFFANLLVHLGNVCLVEGGCPASLFILFPNHCY